MGHTVGDLTPSQRKRLDAVIGTSPTMPSSGASRKREAMTITARQRATANFHEAHIVYEFDDGVVEAHHGGFTDSDGIERRSPTIWYINPDGSLNDGNLLNRPLPDCTTFGPDCACNET